MTSKLSIETAFEMCSMWAMSLSTDMKKNKITAIFLKNHNFWVLYHSFSHFWHAFSSLGRPILCIELNRTIWRRSTQLNIRWPNWFQWNSSGRFSNFKMEHIDSFVSFSIRSHPLKALRSEQKRSEKRGGDPYECGIASLACAFVYEYIGVNTSIGSKRDTHTLQIIRTHAPYEW